MGLASRSCSCGVIGLLFFLLFIQGFSAVLYLYKEDARRMFCTAITPVEDDDTEEIVSEPFPIDFDGVHARAFDPWPLRDLSLPCFPPEDDWKHKGSKPSNNGFIFVKPYKVGSSTASGINLRLARGVAKKLNRTYDVCKARYDHTWARFSYKDYRPKDTLLWTILRDPSTRVLSMFFHFGVSRSKIEPSDANFLDFVNRPNHVNDVYDYYLSALSINPYARNNGRLASQNAANDILKRYNFIGLTERMDESAVVLAMLLGLSVSDTLYLAAKMHGGWDGAGGRTDGKICTYIIPSFISEGVQAFLDSEKWKIMSHWDRMLWQAANRSLDLTIDSLGRDTVEYNLRLYQEAKSKAQEVCLPKTRFPCSIGGKYSNVTDCMWNDSGCGMDCLDEVAASVGIQ